jgi:hypothetical protein
LSVSNPIELRAIETLLVKLGEIPAAGSGSAVRVIDGGDVKETQELIERIRRAWPAVAPNTLVAPVAAPLPEAGKEPSAAEPASPNNPNNSSTKRPVAERLGLTAEAIEFWIEGSEAHRPNAHVNGRRAGAAARAADGNQQPQLHRGPSQDGLPPLDEPCPLHLIWDFQSQCLKHNTTSFLTDCPEQGV